MKDQANRLGMKREIRDPHFSANAGAQAITSLIAEKPDVLVVHKRAEEAGIHSWIRLLITLRIYFLSTSQTKFAAELVSPSPLYQARCGYGQSGRCISIPLDVSPPTNFVATT